MKSKDTQLQPKQVIKNLYKVFKHLKKVLVILYAEKKKKLICSCPKNHRMFRNDQDPSLNDPQLLTPTMRKMKMRREEQKTYDKVKEKNVSCPSASLKNTHTFWIET